MIDKMRQHVKNKKEHRILDAYAIHKSATKAAMSLDLDGGNVRKIIRRLKESVAQEDMPEAYVPKVFHYDIETTNFNGDFGEVLMFAYQWLDDDDPTLVSVLDFPESFDLPVEQRDRYVLKALTDLLNEADIIVAHYGQKFDNKFVQGRLAIHGLPYFDNRNSKMFDTCLIARNNLKIGSNRLANLAQALGLSEEKTSLTKTQWRRANDYCPEALEAMGEYCLQDVRTLVQLAKRLRPLAKHLPSWLVLSGGEDQCCHACGGKLKAKGEWATKANVYERYQCTKCGAWQRSSYPKRKVSAKDRTMY